LRVCGPAPFTHLRGTSAWTNPPTNFRQALAAVSVPAAVHERIERLLRDKASGTELGLSAPDPMLNAFIDQELARLARSPAMARRGQWNTARLDAILAGVLAEITPDSG
jgi:predicted nucleotidyltransferase